MMRYLQCLLACILLATQLAHLSAQTNSSAEDLPVHEKIVVLTFDDSAKSHYTVVRPILKKYQFGATFFITEGFDFPSNKRDYMTWEEISQLHQDGFEIGNHTKDHLGINDANVPKLIDQLEGIAKRCAEHKIPKPVSFAWPGNATSLKAFAILREQGIRFARRGGAPEFPYEKGQGFAYCPGEDHPLLLPSAGDARPNWNLEDFTRAVDQAVAGRISILQFHGTPDTAHAWVNTDQQKFEAYMHYLAVNQFKVIAVRDLEKYIGTDREPEDAMAIIKQRQEALKKVGQ